MEYYDHALSGAVIALAVGAHRRFGPSIAITAAAAAAIPDWDDLPGGVHRISGHSILTAPLAGGLVGGLGFLCHFSIRRKRSIPNTDHSRAALAVWVLVGVLASLLHVLADLAYSGRQLSADWPVALLWPLSPRRWAYPLVPWADRGLTIILATTLVGSCLLPARARLFGVLGLASSVGYVGLWGMWVRLTWKP